MYCVFQILCLKCGCGLVAWVMVSFLRVEVLGPYSTVSIGVDILFRDRCMIVAVHVPYQCASVV